MKAQETNEEEGRRAMVERVAKVWRDEGRGLPGSVYYGWPEDRRFYDFLAKGGSSEGKGFWT